MGLKNFWVLWVTAAALLNGCKKDEILTDEVDTSTEEIVVKDCEFLSGIDKIVCLANALKAQLTEAQLSQLQLSYAKTDAVKWSNFPQALVSSQYKRVGLNLGAMTTEQIGYAKALLKEISGSDENEGYEEIIQVLAADDYLNSIDSRGGYGSSNYYLAFLGTPSTSGTFEIQFGGHHLAVANTYKDGVLTGATPSFRGAEPIAAFTWNGVTNQPLLQEKVAFVAILSSLSTSQLSAANLNGSVSDLVAGPQKDNNFPSTYSGIKVGNLSDAQKSLVLAAIKTYTNDISGGEELLKIYENELDNTYVAFSGETNLNNRGDYIRIDGPSVWIEWAGQPGVAISTPHVHSVWRDKVRDYGGN